MSRDDFSPEVKDIIARRVGMRCSNPNCRQSTSGPREDPEKVINIGVAAHITAAAKGGPRYNAKLTSKERRSIENAIWLCQNCAKLIDNDPKLYTVDLLQRWKKLSEDAARLAIDSPSVESKTGISDEELIRFFAQCFDRPAFQDPFMQEGSMEAFDKAIEDTITAINTGCLRSRDGTILAQAKGKAFLRKKNWRDRMDAIVDLLRAIRSRYDIARKMKLIHVSEHQDGSSSYSINDPFLAKWMDSTRAQITQMFSEIAKEAGVIPPGFPRPYRSHW